MMNDNVVKVKDVLLLNERVFSMIDVWPLKKSQKRFLMYASYLTIHMVIMYMNLFDEFGNLEAMVDNIIDSTIATATYVILFIIRFSKQMKRAIVTVKQEIAESEFNDEEEQRLYFKYHRISDRFGRYAVSTTATIAVLWYLKPGLQLLKPSSEKRNTTLEPYELPFRVHAFLSYQDDLNNFLVMYFYQFPLMFIAMCHISSVSLLLSLEMHVCSKFSILSYRIQTIPTKSGINLNKKIKEFVNGHVQLISTANSINSALEIFLLIELLQTSIRMAVLIYMMLINPNGDLVSAFTYGLYIAIVTAILYLYSFIGEHLSYESTKVSEAYYDTDWHNLSADNQKLLLLAMSSGRRTLHVTAGKFYTFSLNGFIDIVRTSFGYVSLLRALV
ncbi:uncharacterized protein LOC108626927 [Ceratina calcarata]|uniref:Odorant receptor n=1 Tax=Ceratina calcarata TaxID=156304 RepID=A0AAJ7N8U6_9HYME|nr:uncharacterized protein LOC108626927 [Ceratina calcarata]